MATRKTQRRPASSRPRSPVAKVAAHTKPIALTLKLHSETYVRLRTLGATERRTNQDILQEAVQQYLSRVGA